MASQVRKEDGAPRGLDETLLQKVTVDNIKKIDIKEFREAGYLQELNRLFLHPLGMALEVKIEDDGTEALGGIWDYRHDPEGMNYGPGMLDPDKTERIYTEISAKKPVREERLGYFIQPSGTIGGVLDER